MFIRDEKSKQLRKKGGIQYPSSRLMSTSLRILQKSIVGQEWLRPKINLDDPQAENSSSIYPGLLYLPIRISLLEEEPNPKLRPLKNKNYDPGPAPIRGITLSTRKYTRYSLPFKFGYSFLRIESSSGLSLSSRILVR